MEAKSNGNRSASTHGGVAVLERPDTKLLRLAELVMHLTDCSAELAWSALSEAVNARGYPEDHDQCLARVARAMNSLRCGLDLR